MLKILDEPTEPSLLLRKRQAAELLSVSERTFQDLKLPAVKLPGGGIRYSRATLVAWIAQNEIRGE